MYTYNVTCCCNELFLNWKTSHLFCVDSGLGVQYTVLSFTNSIHFVRLIMSNTANGSPVWGSAVITQLIMRACFQMNATLVHLRRHIMETFIFYGWTVMKPRPSVWLRFVTSLVNRQKAVLVKSSYSECSSLINGGHCVSYHCREAGNEFDGVLDVLLCHLYHRAVVLLQRQGVSTSLGHPRVHLKGHGPQWNRALS